MQNNSLINEGNDQPKLTYLNGLWMYFDEIKKRFTINRNKLKILLNIFVQKNKIEEKYATELKILANDFSTKFNNKEDVITTCDRTIMQIVEMFKEESNLMEEKIKFMYDNLIKPLNGFLDAQISCSEEFLRLTINSQADFKLINELFREKELNLMKIGKDLEISLYKIEREKISLENKNEKNKTMEKDDNNNEIKNEGNGGDNKDNINKEDFILKHKRILQKAKIASVEYENFVGIANKEREKFINLSTQMYNHFQSFDEHYIDTIKRRFQTVLEEEIRFMNKYINIKNNVLNNYINLIDVNEDINAFINSKIIKFKIPSEIVCTHYCPQIVLRTRNDPIESKITEKVIEELNTIFLRNKKDQKEKEDIYLFMQNCLKLILEEKDYEKEKLLKLVESKDGRKYFFDSLNQYRIEGIFNLPQKTFDELSFLLNYIIKFATNDEDYDSFKSVVILSQTFYLSNDKNVLLHSNIIDNKIWKEKVFWEKLIEYSISQELNDPKAFYLFLEETTKSKEERINSTINSNIFTYLFNMKLFNFPKDKYKELVDDLVNKYKIDGNSINESLSSINEMDDGEKKDNKKVIKDEKKE